MTNPWDHYDDPPEINRPAILHNESEQELWVVNEYDDTVAIFPYSAIHPRPAQDTEWAKQILRAGAALMADDIVDFIQSMASHFMLTDNERRGAQWLVDQILDGYNKAPNDIEKVSE